MMRRARLRCSIRAPLNAAIATSGRSPNKCKAAERTTTRSATTCLWRAGHVIGLSRSRNRVIRSLNPNILIWGFRLSANRVCSISARLRLNQIFSPQILPILDRLCTIFGFSELRSGQREAIEAVMAGRNVLAVMPTGAGKSLCYQLPAIVRGGLTVVVSPLVALMRDQVAALRLKRDRGRHDQFGSKPRRERSDLVQGARWRSAFAVSLARAADDRPNVGGARKAKRRSLRHRRGTFVFRSGARRSARNTPCWPICAPAFPARRSSG